MTKIKLKGLQGGLEKGKIEEQKEYGFFVDVPVISKEKSLYYMRKE